MRRHPRPRERGIALLLVVWVFMILGVIALDFARYMRDDAMSALNAAEETRGYYLALAGMNRAIFDIERAREGGGKDTQAGNVTPDDPETDDEGDLTSLVNGDWREKTFAGGRYAVRVTDECGRVGINNASANLIRLVVTNLMRGGNATRGVDRRTQGSIDVVVDSILDWRDADDSVHGHGAESDYYLGLRPPYRAKDGWLDSVEELLRVRGVTPALFYGSGGSPGLRDVFSALCSDVRVNLHTAPAAVIQALLAADAAELPDLVAQRDEDFDAFYAVVLQRTGSVCPTADITGAEGGPPVDPSASRTIPLPPWWRSKGEPTSPSRATARTSWRSCPFPTRRTARKSCAGSTARHGRVGSRGTTRIRSGSGGRRVTLGELSQRLRRADFLDGLGVYVGPHEVALAHVTKRFFSVALRHARTFPLPAAARSAERRQALAQAVLTFAGEHHVDTRRAYLCVPRSEAAFTRVVLPAAARENLGQVLEYELEHLVPLPRDQVHFAYSVRDVGEERIEVLLMCIPRDVVRAYLEALEDAFVRPRGIVLTSTAIADYLAFCRGGEMDGSVGLMIGSGDGVELALLTGGRLIGSQLLPPGRAAEPAELSRSLARQLAEGAVAADDVKLYRWELANGAGPRLPVLGEGDLISLAEGRLEAPAEFFSAPEPALLPAVGAALDAVREGSIPVNLLPEEGRKRHEEGISLATVVMVALVGVLLLVWGGSALVKDELLRRQVRDELASVEPQVDEVKKLQDEIASLRKQIDIIAPGQERRVTVLLKELSDLIPNDAYLTTMNLRADRMTLDGFARSASDLIAALEKSKYFKNVSFTSPTTRSGDNKERFSLTAEVEK